MTAYYKRLWKNQQRILTISVGCGILLSSKTWESFICVQRISLSAFSFQSKILRPLPVISMNTLSFCREPTPYGQPVECRFSKSAATSVAFLLIICCIFFLFVIQYVLIFLLWKYISISKIWSERK